MSSNGKFDSLVGQVIDKRYKVLSVVGEGGMAVVFKAQDLTAGRTVAVKVLNESGDSDGHAVKRFLNESKAISMLSHENIVKIYDVSVGRELKYIVMEYVEGETLKEYMDKRGKKLSLSEALGFTEQILLALEHAHSKKVIHRDIKPHNIMVLKNGCIKVTDFGIAKTPSGDTISMTDKALGTVYYVSPEQASGRETGYYTDIYSVGVMLYEMSTGKLPFYADSPVTVAMKQINDDPEPPCKVSPDLPRGLEQVILKAMSKNPEDRFRSAHSMLRAVRILKENPMVIFEDVRSSANSPSKAPVQNGNTKSLKNGALGKLIAVFGNKPEEDGRKKKKRVKNDEGEDTGTSRVTLFPIVLGIASSFLLVLVTVAILFFVSLKNSEKEDKYLTVEGLVGKYCSDELVENLENKGFDVSIKTAEYRNEAYDYGEIYLTEPSEGTRKKIGSDGKVSLELYINPKAGEEVFPDYSIQKWKEVSITLFNAGYKTECIYEESETVLEGYIIRTLPEAGETVKSGDSITVYVSSGKKIDNAFEMPDYTSEKSEKNTKGAAQKELKDAGFEVECINVPHSAKAGRVVWQSVEKGKVISPDFSDKIILHISDGSDSDAVIMPSLVGLDRIDAEEFEYNIKEGNYGTITIAYVAVPHQSPYGTIVSQSIAGGEEIDVSVTQTITFEYSDGSLALPVTSPETQEE